jgi:hypothetical protein
MIHFPRRKVFEAPVRDHGDLQGRYLFHFNVHDRVGTMDFFDRFLLRNFKSVWYQSVRDSISGPLASITWDVRGDTLLKTFWELDCFVLTSLFYYIFKNPTFFDRVTQHTMIRTEVSFFRLSYVIGPFIGWKW